VEVSFPVVVLLQGVEKGSEVNRRRISKRAVFHLGRAYYVAFDLPIITGGSRRDQKTETAEDVELAKIRVLGPVDLLELWWTVSGVKLFPGRDGRCLDLQHGNCSFAWSCQTLTIMCGEERVGRR
jgi:hypothetical protein